MSNLPKQTGALQPSEDGKILSLTGYLTFSNAREIHREFIRLLTGNIQKIDCSQLEHADSTALALLLIGIDTARRQNRHLQVSGLSSRLQSLAGVYGIDQMLDAAK